MKYPALIVLVALGSLTAGLRRRSAQTRQAAFPPPESLILELPQDAVVQRVADDTVLICWRMPAAAHIFVGSLPDGTMQRDPAAVVSDATEVRISGLPPDKRLVFEIVLEPNTPQERRFKAAERVIPLTSAPNLRDLGGYRTTDGRAVRWGLVYRSAMLAYLSDDDQARLSQLGLKWICDLRSDQEVSAAPDRLPPTLEAHYQRLPVDADRHQTYRLWTLLFNHRGLGRLLLGIYRQILDEHAPVFRAVFERLATADNLPALIHCTAGKDRAGLTAALLLQALGVPEATVLADYSQSNSYYGIFRQFSAASIEQLRPLGVTVDDMQPLLVADPAILSAALAHLRTRYGSIEAYLRQHVGLSETVLNRIRENLLEPAR